MLKLLNKYAQKMVTHGLCSAGSPLIGGVNDAVVWNRADPLTPELENVIAGLNINSLIFARPAEPFFSILNYHCRHSASEFIPEDTETRTFLHAIPVARSLTAAEIVPLLQKRKGCVVEGQGIISFGTVSPEQAFVVFSSIIFSAFVKFFVDYAYALNKGTPDEETAKMLPVVLAAYERFLPEVPTAELEAGDFSTEDEIVRAMIQAGHATVNARMVDSFFGNISYFANDSIYISQTGSSLDELEGCIDACPLDDSACTGITASSELLAHRDIYLGGDNRAILHGHPKFSVIMSMLCFEPDCQNRGKCHIRCDKPRFIGDIPVIPGEVGTGPRGLSNTLPPAVRGRRGAIVYGHGVFTLGNQDFRDAFAHLAAIETLSRNAYLKLISAPAEASPHS
ncbi:class II aldolase/adducin family protein [Geopsychrobacter electrodiphilus]|uniref:class II aldolase/adducin family protein n=1 Tax=Geopsychrobacter electrodiphilus TaxID=225196 RepID=UPI000369E2CB|nr:class II aldolase/adducin family protein [Geopsychrobacter electrodiphilus]